MNPELITSRFWKTPSGAPELDVLRKRMNQKEKENHIPLWARVVVFVTGAFFGLLTLGFFLIIKSYWFLAIMGTVSVATIWQAFSKNRTVVYEIVQGAFECLAYLFAGIIRIFN